MKREGGQCNLGSLASLPRTETGNFFPDLVGWSSWPRGVIEGRHMSEESSLKTHTLKCRPSRGQQRG